MNVYDFDKTIYKNDSTADFYFYCLKKHISIIKYLPFQAFHFVRYIFGIQNKTSFKEKFYIFLRGVPDIENEIDKFWAENIKKVKDFYIKTKKADDVVISASPEFLILPICKKLGIECAMASRVDMHTGNYTGLNCHGEEKVRRYRELFRNREIDEFFSDSYSDEPLALIASKAWIVKGNNLSEWKYRHKKEK